MYFALMFIYCNTYELTFKKIVFNTLKIELSEKCFVIMSHILLKIDTKFQFKLAVVVFEGSVDAGSLGGQVGVNMTGLMI